MTRGYLSAFRVKYCSVVFVQFTTPTLDHSISANDNFSHTNEQTVEDVMFA